MIEIIYNDSGKKSGNVIVKPPKNIRQIGSPRGRHKIYMEDYVYTYLHSNVFDGESKKRAAVLLGKSEVSQDIRYTFISSAISCEDFVFMDDSIVFDESCWEYIYKEVKQYFDNQEVVGWFLGMPGFPLDITPAMEAAHRKYFTGREKVLFLSEPAEGEDTFYAYEQGVLQKKEGYYIYYEKNLPMQEYMVCTKEKSRNKGVGIEERMLFTSAEITKTQDEVPPEEENAAIQDSDLEILSEDNVFTRTPEVENKTTAEQALQNYRASFSEKKPGARPKKMNMLLYTAASAAMVVLCVIGVTTLNNYEKMKEVEETLSIISQTPKEKEGITATQPSGLIVESVPGEIEPESDSDKEKTDTTKAAAEKAEAEAAQKAEAAKAAEAAEKAKAQEKTEKENTEKESTETDVETNAEDNTKDTENKEQADANAQQQEQADQTQEPQKPDVENPEEPQAEIQGEADQQSQESVPTAAQTYLAQGYYIVQAGDRLETICKNIYMTTAIMDKVCEANGIEDGDKILAGQKLILP